MIPRAPAGLVIAAALFTVASAAASPVPTLAPDQLSPGQKAVVRTVFQGDTIEEFEAEIVGVLETGRVAGDMIIAKATTDRVIRTGIAQGMSGSPVYVDGKLIGALSSGWSFSREPLFGITPIGEMLEVLKAPETPEGTGTAGPTGIEPTARATPAYRGLSWQDETSSPAREAFAGPATQPASLAPTPLPVPVACVGVAPAALPLARQLLEPLGFSAVPSGRSGKSRGPAPALEPGSAVAIELMRGDLQLAAIGTVTWRDDDRILIFGHPFFQSGAVRLPIASARIATVVGSQLISFKLGSSGAPVGVATQDRRAAVAGRLGGAPRLMPLAVRIGRPGGATDVYRFESVEDRALAPQLVALASVNSLLESGGTGSGQTARWSMTLHRKGASPLVLSDLATGGTMPADLAGGIGQPLAFLYNNPYATLDLDSISVRIQTEPGQDSWSLRGVEILDAAVRPGGSLRVRCEVERWRGSRETIELSMRVPEELPEGRYLLWAGGGAELNRFEAQRLPGRYRPTTLDEAWRRIGGLRSTDQLHVALLAQAPEVTRDGRDYPELPTSALALLSSGLSAEDALRRGSQAILDEQRLSLKGQVRGEVQLEVTVDPKAP